MRKIGTPIPEIINKILCNLESGVVFFLNSNVPNILVRNGFRFTKSDTPYLIL